MEDVVPRRSAPSATQARLHRLDVAVAGAENDLDLVLRHPRLVDPRHPSGPDFPTWC